MVGGHHLHLDLGGVSVSRARPGPVLPADRRLVDGRPSPRRARRRRARDGPVQASPRPWADPPLRPGLPAQYTAVLFTKRCATAGIEVSMARSAIAMTTPSARPSTPPSRRSGSTGNPGRPAPRHAPRSSPTSRAVQPPPPALHARLPLPDRVRTTPRRARPTDARNLDFGQRIGRVDLAERRTRAYNASHLDGRRRFPRQRLDLFRERPRWPNRVPLRPRRRQSRDGRQRVASPLGGQGASSLIKTSTPKVKTCRPNRGRSTRLPRSFEVVAQRECRPACLTQFRYVAELH